MKGSKPLEWHRKAAGRLWNNGLLKTTSEINSVAQVIADADPALEPENLPESRQ